MPSPDFPTLLIARFLKSNNYTTVRFPPRKQPLLRKPPILIYQETLDAFIQEAGLPLDAGNVEKGDLTIENILEEKRVFDVSMRFERGWEGNGEGRWKEPAPSTPHPIPTLPTSSNLLHISIAPSPTSKPNLNLLPPHPQVLLATTADRRFHLLSPRSPDFTLLKSHTALQDSPILSCVVLLRTPHLTTVTSGMSGQVVLYDHEEDRVLEERRDHGKYVVRVSAWEDECGAWVGTAGWDGKVVVYWMERGGGEGYEGLGSPVASVILPTNPETILLVSDPDTGTLYLIVTRRDSTSLYYYTLPSLPADTSTSPGHLDLQLAGSQNLAPHSNAWIAFSPSSIALSPTDPTLLAVATSAVPHMKLIIVRLLFPPLASSSAVEPATQAAQTRMGIARQDREDTAILVHCSTLAPQTPYSTPQVYWRPDGSGVWVNGDDGVLRGIEAKTGKIVASLKGGHDPGSKIRSIWAGWVGDEGDREEWVVSGGFDRRLIVWKVAEDSNAAMNV